MRSLLKTAAIGNNAVAMIMENMLKFRHFSCDDNHVGFNKL
jgi:hypothetical protein